jgi:hypothetical protein
LGAALPWQSPPSAARHVVLNQSRKALEIADGRHSSPEGKSVEALATAR